MGLRPALAGGNLETNLRLSALIESLDLLFQFLSGIIALKPQAVHVLDHLAPVRSDFISAGLERQIISRNRHRVYAGWLVRPVAGHLRM